MRFTVADSSALKIFKTAIFPGLADHYYLSEYVDSPNSLGWGPNGLELKGSVRVTHQELERIEQFISAAQYSIEIHNCEHFANYVLYEINLSSQQYLWWKSLGAGMISRLQPVQSIRSNYNHIMGQQISDVLQENLRQAKIDQANRRRIEFWKSKGIDIQ
jgi:hypothetical protein